MTAVDVPAVTAANAELYAAFETGDLDRMRAVWDDADDVVCIHPGWDELRGISHVMRSWAMIFANTPYIQFVLTDVDVQVGGELAVVRCAENILTAIGDPGGDAKVIATNVFRRRGSDWRLWLHHGSPVLQTVEEEAGDG
jgi:ketosteroid isomerase-like protein